MEIVEMLFLHHGIFTAPPTSTKHRRRAKFIGGSFVVSLCGFAMCLCGVCVFKFLKNAFCVELNVLCVCVYLVHVNV